MSSSEWLTIMGFFVGGLAVGYLRLIVRKLNEILRKM
jgi:hypothetical protein